MTKEQQQWVETMQAMANQTPERGPRPAIDTAFGRFLYKVVTSYGFDAFIIFIIVSNVGLMASSYWQIELDTEVNELHLMLMRLFMYIYYVECVLKLAALGANYYFSDMWCRFDFFLIVVSLLDQFAHEAFDSIVPVPPFLLRVLRIVRVLRILRLLKGAKELRNLIVTLLLSFPSLLNVSCLLALCVFIYSVLGMQMFSSLVRQENINDARNFETLSSAALLLFQCLTGDAWSGMMADATVGEVSELCSNEDGNCGSWLAIPYFISFQVLGTFVFLNLVVAIILENFSSLGNMNPDLVSAADIETFKEAWTELDPDVSGASRLECTVDVFEASFYFPPVYTIHCLFCCDSQADNYIASKDLVTLVLRVPPPMGLSGVGDPIDAQRLCLKLSVTQVGGMVSFGDVLTALTKLNYTSKAPGDSTEFMSLGEPQLAAAPPLPVNKALTRGKTNADMFASDLPSARRVFALQVIEKHLQMRQQQGGAWNSRLSSEAREEREKPPPVPRAGYIASLDHTPGETNPSSPTARSRPLKSERQLSLEEVPGVARMARMSQDAEMVAATAELAAIGEDRAAMNDGHTQAGTCWNSEIRAGANRRASAKNHLKC